MNAVVIGAEDTHCRAGAFRSIPVMLRPSYPLQAAEANRPIPAEKAGNVAQITHQGELWLYCGRDFVAIIFRLFGKAPGFGA